MMPLASISKITSICGIPFGAGRVKDMNDWPFNSIMEK